MILAAVAVVALAVAAEEVAEEVASVVVDLAEVRLAAHPSTQFQQQLYRLFSQVFLVLLPVLLLYRYLVISSLA